MLSRQATTTANFSQRASAMRRLRRRSNHTNPGRLYCGTNGCTSFLVADPGRGRATCQICGYERRLS